MSYSMFRLLAPVVLASLVVGCSDGSDRGSADNSISANEATVFSVANSCFAISPDGEATFLSVAASGATYESSAASAEDGSWFLLRPSDLGRYLLYDENKGYLVSDGQRLTRQLSLTFDTTEVDGEVVIEDKMQSEGEWELLAAGEGFILQHIKTARYIGTSGMVADEAEAAELAFIEQPGCAEFPELSLNASGDITVTEFENDGSVFGFVDAHSHLFSNIAFGGTGLYHGAPFDPLGVEHALEDCNLVHGEEGRKDLMGAGFASSDGGIDTLLGALITGELPEKNHDTEGYPDFTDWPNAPSSSTHQVQYYKWIERAYMSGLRLMVQHATTNQYLCQLVVGIGSQPKGFDCNDMVAVDRIIEATYALERYVDALSGGPGEGWFRIVFSPAEAREQIKAGKLAVVLGIEASDLFDCFLVPYGDFSQCTEADVVAQLDEYYDKGVRVLFPVHKYDNAFSAGDGDRGIIDIGNFGHTGHYNSYVECSEELLEFRAGFDNGGVAFPDLNRPRDEFDSEPPVDMSGFEDDPLGSLLPYASLLGGEPLAGDYCQQHGLTDLGEFLIAQMMQRGMIIELDHLPRKSVKRTLNLLQENDYPAMGTHGQNYNGLLYELGGMSKSNLGRCRSADTAATMDDGFQARIQLIRDKGGFPAEGFAFDLNGFAGAPGPRFGQRSGCSTPQTDEGITYPFTSYAGDVTLERPVVGNRTLDFNTEGMVHLGLVAEVIEDVRRDGVTDEELEPLFKSAEGYIRVWEKSESRGQALSQ
jgi:hypothetical protein